MSCLLGVISDGCAYLAADSRGIRSVNGVRMIADDNCQKLYTPTKNQVIFTSGTLTVAQKILSMYNSLTVQQKNLDSLKHIIDTVHKTLTRDEKLQECAIEITLCEWINDDFVLHNFREENNEIVYKQQSITNGCLSVGTNHAKFHEEFEQKLVGDIDISNFMNDAFNTISSIRIGGKMTMYALHKDNGIIWKVAKKIVDHKEYPRISDIHLDPKHGLVITQADSKMRIVMNAQDGVYFQKGDGQGSMNIEDFDKESEKEHWKEKPVYITPNGDAAFGGELHAKILTLQEIGGENIITYINRKTNSYTKTNEYTPNATEVKLSGEFLEGRGLKSYDNYNNLRVKIDGNTGALEMYNGKILMEDNDGSSLQIDPQDFLTWVVKGQKKFWYDKANNALKFGGTIDTRENANVGAELTVGAVSENPVIHLNGMGQDVCTIKGDVSGDKSTTIDSAGHLILKGSMGVYLKNADSDNRVVTADETEKLNNAIADLKGRIKVLENKLGI